MTDMAAAPPASGEEINALASAFARFVEEASATPNGRAMVEALAQALLAFLSATEPRMERDGATADGDADSRQDVAAGPSVLDMFRQSLGEITADSPMPKVAIPLPTRPVVSVPHVVRASQPQIVDLRFLQEMQDAFRAKLRAARWAVEARERGIASGGQPPAELLMSLQPPERLWMCVPDLVHTRPVDAWRRLAMSFESLAEALGLVEVTLKDGAGADDRSFSESIWLLAEAQSGVRAATAAIRDGGDPDQERVHHLLREITRDWSIYLPRFMKLSDAPTSAEEATLVSRIQKAAEPIRTKEQRERQAREAQSLLRYHLDELPDSIAHGTSADRQRHWSGLFAAIEALVSSGLIRPSDASLRDRLLPLLDSRPDSLVPGPGTSQVLRETDRYLESRERAESVVAGAAQLSPQVIEVASLLQGGSIVLIAGERRVEQEERLVRAFNLSHLFWLEGFDHSYTNYESTIGREDVRLVLLAVRWASHETNNVRLYCDRYGKPFVRLPAGYNANQIAAQVLEQAADRLRDR